MELNLSSDELIERLRQIAYEMELELHLRTIYTATGRSMDDYPWPRKYPVKKETALGNKF